MSSRVATGTGTAGLGSPGPDAVPLGSVALGPDPEPLGSDRFACLMARACGLRTRPTHRPGTAPRERYTPNWAAYVSPAER